MELRIKISPIELSPKDIERFKSHYKESGEKECWNWNGKGERLKHPQIKINGKSTYAHRIAFVIKNGSDAAINKVIRHTCDNLSCVNPSHLLAGTIDDNIFDRNSRNRQARGDKSGRRKLSSVDIQDIRNKYIPRVTTLKILAEEYGVTLDQIHRIIRFKSWSHLK